MNNPLAASFRLLPRPTWGPALVVPIGCGLPLLLGLFSEHPGFYWATIGAFAAGLANPLARLGVPAMLTIAVLGASQVALGFWTAATPLITLLLFAATGGLIGLLSKLGHDFAKLGLIMAVCLTLGFGQHGLGSFDNPVAIAVLFLLGALGVVLLGFGLRGIHGLRMWPPAPSLTALHRMWRHPVHRSALWPMALTLAICFGLAGWLAAFLRLPQGHWLPLATLTLLFTAAGLSWRRQLALAMGLVGGAFALVFGGYSLIGTTLMVWLALTTATLCRLLQATGERGFLLQTTLVLVVLSESLATTWDQPQWRLINASAGVAIAGVGIAVAHLLATRLRHADN